MIVLFLFINLFIVGMLVFSLWNIGTGKQGPFSKYRMRNRVVLSFCQALVLSLLIKMVLM